MASRFIGPELKEYVLFFLGASEAGKSTAGNFIAGKEVFPTGLGPRPLTRQPIQHTVTFNRTVLRLIDSVGLDDYKISPDEVLRELTRALLVAAEAGGVHAFLICVNVETLFSSSVKSALEDLEKMKNFWPHAIVLFTNAGKWGDTDSERDRIFNGICKHPSCPDKIRWLMQRTRSRKVFVEYDDLYLEGRRERTVDAIVYLVKILATEEGFYTNSMIEAARQYWEEYKFAERPKIAGRIVSALGKVTVAVNQFSLICRGIKESRKRQKRYIHRPVGRGGSVCSARQLPGSALSPSSASQRNDKKEVWIIEASELHWHTAWGICQIY